jgi:hypothetical protein
VNDQGSYLARHVGKGEAKVALIEEVDGLHHYPSSNASTSRRSFDAVMSRGHLAECCPGYGV